LFLYIIYIFTIYAFTELHDDYIFSNESNGFPLTDPNGVSDFCLSLLNCFLNTVDHSLKDNSGIGGWLYNNPKYLDRSDLMASDIDLEQNYEYNRWVYDNLFNFLLIIILL